MRTGKNNVELHNEIVALRGINADLKLKLDALEARIRENKFGSADSADDIRENEERLRAMFEHTGDGILLVDRETYQVCYANQTFCNLLGYSREEISGISVRNVHSANTQYRLDHLFQRSEMGKVELLENIPLKRKNGPVFYTDIQITYLRIAGCGYIMADFRDVTERKQAEAELKLNEMRLNSLLELSEKAYQLSEQEITRTVAGGTIRLTCSEIGCIYFIDQDGQCIQSTSSFEQETRYSQISDEIFLLLEQEGLWAECIETQKPVIKNECNRMLGKKEEAEEHYHLLSRLILVPIIEKGTVSLILVVGNKAEDYDDTDIKQVQLIGYQLIRILERKQADVSLKRYAKEQSALYAVTSAASAFLDPDHLLTTVLNLVLNLPGIAADTGWVTVLEDWPRNTPRLVAMKGCQDPMPRDQLSAWQRNCKICLPLLDNQEPSPDTVPIMPCACSTYKCPGNHDIQSHIAVPIRTGKRTLGLIILAWRKPIPFTSADYALLMAIGKQVGLGLRNAQLYQAAAQSNRLKVLNALSTAAGSSLEMDVVLKQVLDLTCSAVQAASGAILQLDPNRNCLVFSRTYGQNSENLQGMRLPLDKGIAGWVAEHSQVACVNDVHKDNRWFDVFDQQTNFETHSVLCAPLLYRGEVTGVIEVLNKQKEDFSQEDVSLLESVAAIISVAMANAQLFAATRSRAEELETISQIGLTLTASLDFKGVVQNALFQIQQLFKAEGVSLLRLDEPTQDMVFIYALLGKKSREVTTRVSSEENRMIKWAVEHRDALLVRDTTRDPRFNEEASAILLGPPPASIMVTPMLTSTRVVGILLVASAEVDHFTEANLHTLQAISATLTVALENASLYENLKTLLHERELSQANIVQTSKMAALGQLSASIAHEINNPLQAMQGCLTLFSEEMNDACRKEKLEHYLHIVQSEIERITNIVSRMKDYYRPEREGIQTIHLHTSLETVLDLTFKKLQQNLIIVERKWADVPIQLQANEDRLKQVFLNLVLNALDAMPGGGVLTITTRQDRIDRKGALPVPAVRIEFKDTGAGMTPDVQANIFEPFFTTKESGSGLGLYVVYGIIQAHQGEIRVFSKPGLGTTFCILLPLEQV